MQIEVNVQGDESEVFELVEKDLQRQYPELLKNATKETRVRFLQWFNRNAKKSGMWEKAQKDEQEKLMMEIAEDAMWVAWHSREPDILKGAINGVLLEFLKERHQVLRDKCAALEDGRGESILRKHIAELEDANRKLRHTIDNILHDEGGRHEH